MSRVLIVSTKPWNEPDFRAWSGVRLQHNARLITAREDLTEEMIDRFGPDYIFFLHWSWRIPAAIHQRYTSIVFHMTDVPFGRGGSPLQNLVSSGLQHTQLSALRVAEAVDAGPVYLKRPLCLLGSAEEIFIRASALAFAMIDEIIDRGLEPTAQTGAVIEFKRRTPAESEIPASASLLQVYDHIRMLDADTYPTAFLIHGRHRYEFSRATLRTGHIAADVKIVPLEKDR